MIIKFTAENFRSIKKATTLDFLAVPTCEERKNENTHFIDDRVSCLKNVVIYGANASGKSNLIRAFKLMRDLVINSSRESQAGDPLPYDCFLLDVISNSLPTSFELEFFMDKKFYRYGFAYNKTVILKEWLFQKDKKGDESFLFVRKYDAKLKQNQINDSNEFPIDAETVSKTRKNALLLSVCAQFSNKKAERILGFFRQQNVIEEDLPPIQITTDLIAKGGEKARKLQQFIKSAGLDVVDIKTEKYDISDDFFERIKNVNERFIHAVMQKTTVVHNLYDDNGHVVGKVNFDFENNESAGTQKFLILSGFIIDTLMRGAALFVDELDSIIHPLLANKIVALFNSKETNPNGAQLIITTHNVNLLDAKLFNGATGNQENLLRRDQIYFLRKNDVEASHINSLIEIKTNGSDSFQKEYLQGRYGAIPVFSDFSIGV